MVKIEDVATTDANPRTTTSTVPFDLDNLFLAEGDVVQITASHLADTIYNWTIIPASHGTFDPNDAEENSTNFTPAARAIEPVLPLSIINLGFNAHATIISLETRIVEQQAIRMLMAEARDLRISEVERIGLLWIARNRLVSKYTFPGAGSLTGILRRSTFSDWAPAASRGTLPDILTKREYDKVTDIAGKVLSEQVGDNTQGSLGFVTPTAGDLVKIQNAINNNSTADARDLGLDQIPGLPAVPSFQIVLINGLRAFTATPRPFILFREKPSPEALTVLDLR